jgi:hypothetical protein
MAVFMMVIGWKTRCKVRVCISGLMDVSMKGTTIRTRNMDLEYINGLMEESMKEHGKRESNMVKANMSINKVSLNLEYGKTVSEPNG